MTEALPRESPAWRALKAHRDEIVPRHLRELFAADPDRGRRLSVEAAGLYVDYSKNRVSDETLLSTLIDEVRDLNSGDLNDDIAILGLGCS